MYIGIYISDSFISAAFVDQEGEVVLINDDSSTKSVKHLTPLTIYLENNFAYVGSQVDCLIADDYNLSYGGYFLDQVEHTNAAVYKDSNSVGWNAVAMIAIFLRKIKMDIQLYDDHPIQGAIVTISKSSSATSNRALQMAFKMAEIKLCGIIDLGRAALNGYRLKYDRSRHVLLYDLNLLALTVSVLRIEEGGDKTLAFGKKKELGEHLLYKYLINFLFKKYEKLAKREVKRDKKNVIRLQQLVKEVLGKYISEEKSFVKVIYSFEDPIVELVITRAQLDQIVGKYLQQNLSFLKETLSNSGLAIEDISEVMVTGTAKIDKLIVKQLQRTFGVSIEILNYSPEEIITRGVAQCANHPGEREMSASSLAAYQELNVIKNENLTDRPNYNELTALVNAMHINVVDEG